MDPSESFRIVLERLQAGDQGAASQVFNRFAERLIGLARSRLDERLRRKIDPEDVVQSVCKSFFVRQAEGQFQLESWDNLWTVLTVLTVRKCANQARHFRTGRRDIRREASAQASDDDSAGDWEAVNRAPTPLEAAELADTVEQLMSSLDERDRTILVLGLQGKSVEEISAEVQYAPRTVRRVLAQVKDRLLAETAAIP